VEEVFTLRHARRILKLLGLDDADIDADAGNNVRRYDVKIELSDAQIKKLQLFSDLQMQKKMSAKERIGILHDVDAILESFIVDVSPEWDFDFTEDYTAKLKYYLPSSHDLFWAILLGGGVAFAYLLWVGLPVWKWFLLLIIVSSLWHWGHMYKKATLKKHMTLVASAHIPEECFKQSWTDLIFGASKKCSDYHDALLVDPLWEVTPTMAVAETLTLLIVQPMEHVGLHLGKFFNSLLLSQSWLSAPAVLVSML